jgi:hypothetical protein
VGNTRLFDVVAEPWSDEAVDDVRNLNLDDEVDLRVTPMVGEAFTELRTTCRLAALDAVVDVPDVAGAAAAGGAAATGTATATPIPAVSNPIARSGRTGMAIAILTRALISLWHNDFSHVSNTYDFKLFVIDSQIHYPQRTLR